jgi:ABC-2 type transport system permease protein
LLTNSTVGRNITGKIRDGSISVDFVRPVSFKGLLFCENIGNNIYMVLVLFIPVCVIAILGYGFIIPDSFFRLFSFLFSMFLGIYLALSYSYLLSLVSFWLIENPFLSWHFRNVENIFSGQFIPIWFYPAWLVPVTIILPFRYFAYEAIAIYLGKTSIENIIYVLIGQFCWVLLFYMIERVVWHFAYRKVVVQGG